MTTPAAPTARRTYADLLAAARAAVAAYLDGDPDPLALLIDHLDAIGELPDTRVYWPTALAELALGDGPLTARRLA